MNIQDKTLRTILAEHKQWVYSHGEEGVRADFSGLFLPKVDLSRANMRYADMTNVDLQYADLSGVIRGNK